MDHDVDLFDSPTTFHNHHWVASAVFRTHLQHLLAGSGLPWRAIALYADLPAGLVRRLAGTRPPKRIPADVAANLLSVDVVELERLRCRTGRWEPVARQLSWLVDHGHDARALAQMVQMRPEEVERTLQGRRWCSQRTELLARSAVHAHLQRPPQFTDLTMAA